MPRDGEAEAPAIATPRPAHITKERPESNPDPHDSPVNDPAESKDGGEEGYMPPLQTGTTTASALIHCAGLPTCRYTLQLVRAALARLLEYRTQAACCAVQEHFRPVVHDPEGIGQA